MLREVRCSLPSSRVRRWLTRSSHTDPPCPAPLPRRRRLDGRTAAEVAGTWPRYQTGNVGAADTNSPQTWRVFIRIEELFILVPILLNLKGNLEMNLAARFSTSANIGELDLRLTRRSLILGNLALLQVQALIVSLISGLLAFVLGMASRRGVHHALQNPMYDPASSINAAAGGLDATANLRGGYFEALLVLCVSMLAAGISSGVLGSFMCSLVVLCRRFRVNPGARCTCPRRGGAAGVRVADPQLARRQHRHSGCLCARRHGDPGHPRGSLESLHHLHGCAAAWPSSTRSRSRRGRSPRHAPRRHNHLDARLRRIARRHRRQRRPDVSQRLRARAAHHRLGSALCRHGHLEVRLRPGTVQVTAPDSAGPRALAAVPASSSRPTSTRSRASRSCRPS